MNVKKYRIYVTYTKQCIMKITFIAKEVMSGPAEVV